MNQQYWGRQCSITRIQRQIHEAEKYMKVEEQTKAKGNSILYAKAHRDVSTIDQKVKVRFQTKRKQGRDLIRSKAVQNKCT
ncbi:hypothetical protein JTE90_006776 [Oedothorax gibbosus]|uniref:Uncharacterized protein n=1 Tax=Oedothorax gibbosus TaxID=931172 RepID=A0AAV6UL03_9ARAC|nr:hypothetical protein JTE90_006776 [Oedothorax gibbosus]